jgi:hypothetical protein
LLMDYEFVLSLIDPDHNALFVASLARSTGIVCREITRRHGLT